MHYKEMKKKYFLEKNKNKNKNKMILYFGKKLSLIKLN